MVKYTAIKEKDSYKVDISKCFEDIYDALASEKSTKLFDNKISLFVFSAAVGYKYNNPKDILQKSDNAIHCQPISERQLATIFSIIVNDATIGKNFENFIDSDFLSKGLKLVEKYAQGGMEILCDKVFDSNWNGKTLAREYKEYDVDLLRFIYEERTDAPF